jgi:predicted ABC-type transport system involved in lysophospholipase L1 biosynthesis ATPase subunit
MIFQFFNLLDDLTVLDNVLLPAQLAGVRRTDARARAAAPTPAAPSQSRRSSRIPNGTLGHAFVLGACHPRWRTPADVRIH